MRHTFRLVTSMAFAVCAACACASETGLEVIVNVDPKLGADQLAFALSAPDAEPTSVVAPDPPALLEGEQSAGFQLPPAYADADVTVVVTATQRDVVVGSGEGTIKATSGTITVLAIELVAAFTCGDGAIESIEECDDGNGASGDGCDSACAVEPAYNCAGAPSVCVLCGDSSIDGIETCDDGNVVAGDGCDALCAAEGGWTCNGEPSACAPICGDGLVRGIETCDDGGLAGDDGCSSTCLVETGWSCDAGEPSVCAPVCGDGVTLGDEACDDLNGDAGDGCGACQVEAGWTCSGSPSSCAPICGDSLVRGNEVCDDAATLADDGCAADCSVEIGWSCDGGEPTECAPICGDGAILGGETCDDGGVTLGDGCDDACQIEGGWTCGGAPSVCAPICGDTLVRGPEACDDGATAADDGCAADCTVELGWTCDAAEPTLCAPDCGDGRRRGDEACDDADLVAGDGCDAQCDVELGFLCSGEPSTCVTDCGDGIPAGAEECDEGVANNSDVTPDACRTDCTNPFCGDLVADPGFGEDCDDANTDNTDGCLNGCRAPGCGDGFVLGAEQCDDGAATPGDGCDGNCNIEIGSQCGGAPSICRVNARAHLVAPAGGDFTTVSVAEASGTVLAGDLLILSANTFNEDPNIDKSLTIVGVPGTTIQGSANNSATILVQNGADVVVQGVVIRNNGNNQSAVQVQDAGSSIALTACTLGPSDEFGVDARAGTTVTIARSVVTANASGGLQLAAAYTIENSVIRENSVRGVAFLVGSSGTFRFNTLGAQPLGALCNVASTLTSSIVFGNNTNVQGNCNVDTSLVGVDPLLAGDGIHLNAGSIAIDGAPLAGCPAVDFDNDARPIGLLCDVGADER